MLMEKKTQKIQNDGPSDHWSLCSDQYPSDRFPKVSIGIMVDKYQKMESVVRKEDAAALPSRAVLSSCQEKVLEESNRHALDENRGPEVIETLEVKEAEAKDQKASAWFSSRSICHETPTTKTIQFYANRASIIQSENGLHKKLDTVAYEKRNGKDNYVERVEEIVEKVTFATVKEAQMSDKGDQEETEEMVECNNETLRMKLWEILGTGTSQSKHNLSSSKIEEEKENLNINHDRGCRRSKESQPKHFSDTIETDSESPNKMTRRPITRSLTRRRAPPKATSKLQGGINYRKEPLSYSLSDSKLKLQEENVFVFNEEGKSESLAKTNSGHSSKSKGKRSEKKMVRTEPQRTPSWRPLVPQKGLQHRERVQTLPLTVKESLNHKEKGDFPSSCHGEQDLPTPSIQLARSGPQRSCFPKKLVPEKDYIKREQILPSTDKSSEQSQESGSSLSTPCQVKGFNQASSLQKKVKTAELKSYTRGLVSEEKLHHGEREKRLPSPDGASIQNKEVPNDSHHSQADARKDFGNLPFIYKAETPDTFDDPSSRKKKYSWENVMSPSVSKDSYLQKKVASPPLPGKTDLFADFPSPTFAMNATPPSPSSCKQLNETFSSPELDKPRTVTRKSYSSKMFDGPRPGSCGSDANTEFSDGTKKSNRSEGTEDQHMKENETGNISSLSPMEDQDTESFEAGDFMRKGFSQSYKLFPDAGSPSESSSKLQRSERVHHNKDAIPRSGFRQVENLSHDGSPKKSRLTHCQTKRVKGLKDARLRTEATTGLHNASEKYPENSWESDLVELALVLERFKANLKSHTSNKSSEILSATAEKIRLQLQDVESQMQADIGKFISTGNAKRKRFESRLQGKQERLRLVYDKFKEEVNQQLQDCKNTLEELEAHRMKLKGNTDRQKASHKKLLLQVEKVMKVELRDAETMISAIDKEARKKMYGLKHVLKEWMEDGVMR